MVVVLGIDPGTAHTGYGVVLSRGQHARGARRRRDRDRARASRSSAGSPSIHARVCDLIAEHRPTALAVEELYFGQNARTAFAVGQARGVVLLSAGMAGVPCFSYTPQAVKQAVCGSGARREGPGAADGGRAALAARAARSPTTRPTRWRWPSATRTARR